MDLVSDLNHDEYHEPNYPLYIMCQNEWSTSCSR